MGRKMSSLLNNYFQQVFKVKAEGTNWGTQQGNANSIQSRGPQMPTVNLTSIPSESTLSDLGNLILTVSKLLPKTNICFMFLELSSDFSRVVGQGQTHRSKPPAEITLHRLCSAWWNNINKGFPGK
jgi:hypothetical protein